MEVSPEDAEPVEPDPPSYPPTTLLIDVVHLLRARGLTVPTTYERSALRAAANLLRALGIEPIQGAAPPTAPGPVVTAAAVMLRAAGVNPDAIVRWPRSDP